MGLSGRSGSGFLVRSVSSGSPVVESGDPETGGSESLSSDTGPQLFLRRLGHRLGGPGGRTSRLRYLVSQPGQSLDQHERAGGGAERSPGPRAPSRRSVGGSVLRQHHHGRLSPSFRRNIFLGSKLQGEGGSPVGGGPSSPSPSPVHHGVVQRSGGHSESSTQVIGSEWTLHQAVVDRLIHQWPAVIDLFTSSMTARLPVYFSSASDPMAAGTDALLQPWNDLQAYAFPPIAIIGRVLLKLRSSKNCELTLITPFWPQRDWFPNILELLSDIPIELPKRRDLLRQPHFHRFHQNPSSRLLFCSGWTTCLLSKEVHTYELSSQVGNL